MFCSKGHGFFRACGVKYTDNSKIAGKMYTFASRNYLLKVNLAVTCQNTANNTMEDAKNAEKYTENNKIAGKMYTFASQNN